jgi:glycosyltransferase involved in cell wall biosynthesis
MISAGFVCACSRLNYEDNVLQHRISAIIPLYNGAAYIEEALRSILTQYRPADEIIVVDDGSTDGGAGADIVRKIAELHPVTLLTKPNGGQGSARNYGIRISTGDLIALLDQDDAWYPHHLQELEKPFYEPAHRPLGWVYSNLDQMRSDGLMLNFSMLNMIAGLEHPKTTLFRSIGSDLFILPGATLIARKAFDAVGGFDETLIGYEDDDFFLRLFMAGYGNQYLGDSMTKWRVHANSTSYTYKMARSRAKYFEILQTRFPDEPKMDLYYTRDIFVPRFLPATLGDFVRAWRDGNVELMQLSQKQLRYYRKYLPFRRWLKITMLLTIASGPLRHPRIAPYAQPLVLAGGRRILR